MTDAVFIAGRLLLVLPFTALVAVSAASRHDTNPGESFVHNPLQRQLLQQVNRKTDILGVEPKTSVQNADFREMYHDTVNQTSQMLYIYSYNETNVTTAVRISVVCFKNASDAYPVMFVARQQEGVLSWRLPLDIVDGYSYWVASRTLCPLDKEHRKTSKGEQFIYMGVSTMSESNVAFNLTAERLDDFELAHNTHRTEEVAASRPVYYMYTFPDGVDTVLLKVSSKDKVCMTVSVQNVKCPVLDLDNNVEYQGKHQTMSTQAAMYLQRDEFDDFGSFYVVFVVKPNNKACEGKVEPMKILAPSKVHERKKTITLEIRETIGNMEYIKATLVVVFVFLGFYIIAALIGFVYVRCGWNKGLDELTEGEREDLALAFEPSVQNVYDNLNFRGNFEPHSSTSHTDSENARLLSPGFEPDTSEHPFLRAAPARDDYGAISNDDETSRKELGAVHRSESEVSTNSSVDVNDIDFLPDADKEKDIFRLKTALFVSDLSRKKYSKQRKAYKLYTWNLLTISIFYALPAIQLVITYHRNLNESGNEDLCYYNFDCAHPFKDYLSSFNNVFSNIGYVMLGFLFVLIVYRRDRLHRVVLRKYPHLERDYGLPQFFGLYYAMGFALIMEGIMSASYHVCPTSSNFQFDTSFMYIIACLCMLRIYQTRHPDVNAKAHAAYFSMAVVIERMRERVNTSFMYIIACLCMLRIYQTRHPDVNAKAHTAYFSMAVVILVAVFGVVYGTNILWIFYALIHMFFSFILTAQIYFVGRWRIDRYIFKKILLYILVDCKRCSRPVYPNRFVLLFIANAINWAFALYGAIEHPSDFASYLLAIFIGNLVIYCVFYIVMKMIYKERLSWFVILLIAFSALTWAGALYFFFQHLTTWAKTPAGSREGNQDCILMSFYDAHDVWHFLSAISLFVSFLILFMLDNNLTLKRRDRIPVF